MVLCKGTTHQHYNDVSSHVEAHLCARLQQRRMFFVGYKQLLKMLNIFPIRNYPIVVLRTNCCSDAKERILIIVRCKYSP